jgi:hypothetical protein
MAMAATELVFGVEPGFLLRAFIPQWWRTQNPPAQFVNQWLLDSVTQAPLDIHDFDALHNGPIVLSVQGAEAYRLIQAGPVAQLPAPLSLGLASPDQP